MTVPLSRLKTRRLLQLYFAGRPQPTIAEQLGITQATVSNYAARFSSRTEEIGLLNAAEEHDIMKEVLELRSLSVEMVQADLTTQDAHAGIVIIKKFNLLGINPERHEALVQACKHADDPAFPEAVVKLSLLEKQTGMTYGQIITRYQQVKKELPQLESSLEVKQKLDSEISDHIVQVQKKYHDEEHSLTQFQADINTKKSQLDKDLADKMQEAHLKIVDVEMAKQLKDEVTKRGLDMGTLIKLAKEFNYGNIKH